MSDNKQNFVVTGYLDRNFGDDMMIRILADAFPDGMFYINFSKIDAAMSFESIPNIRPNTHSPEILQNLTAMVEIGGSIYHIYKKIALRRLKTFLATKRYYGGFSNNTKMVTLGCNINPIRDRRSAFVMKMILNGSALFTVREQFSIDTAKKIAPSSNSYRFHDIVFSMPDSFIDSSVPCENALGISVYRSYFSAERARHYSRFCKKMTALSDAYIEQTGNDVILLAFDTGNENDLHAAHYIRDHSRHPEKIRIVAHDDDGTNIINAIKRCRVVLGVRFHSIVMSIRLGVPFIPVAYSAKTDHLLEDLHYNGKLYRYESIADEPTETILCDLLSAEAMPLTSEVRESAAMHIKKLKEVIQKG